MSNPITARAVGCESRAGRGLPIPNGPEDEESLLLPLRSVTQILKPSSYANVLVVFAPLGIAFGLLHKTPALVFSFNFLAIASLSKLNGRRIVQLSAILGPLPGGILYALFDNAPLLIVCMAAIQNGDAHVAKSCVLGSVLANLLLVMGWCFFVAGTRHSVSSFSASYASKASSLMIVASSALVVPSAISEARCTAENECEESLVHVSRAVSICLLVLFTTYLHYRLRSHRVAFIEFQSAHSTRSENAQCLSVAITEATCLVVVLVLVSMCAYFLVRTLDVVSDSRFISARVASFVLLPIATDGPSRVEAIVAAYRGEMPKALDFAVSRSMHVALFVAPVLVLFSWAIQSSYPMTLHFPTSETISLFLGTILLAEVCRDGESDYLEGAMCIIMYVLPDYVAETSSQNHRYMILSFSF
ncbi:Ca2+ transporter [Thelonectria olida]|uniref:Vacuolar calcium ion transporter n=1 Tax=Thelonectria olida TaxID=1576542 RepID=A0A9P8W277_9HYPO|nr:Ca2+ transporter [Thelonectria olida]